MIYFHRYLLIELAIKKFGWYILQQYIKKIMTKKVQSLNIMVIYLR